MSALIKATRPKRYFYAENINMNWSFDSLFALAKKYLGAEPELGDILICDNKNKDKRKVLQVVERNGQKSFMIFYGRVSKDYFVPLADHSGKIKALTKEIL
jgi:transposase